MISREIYKEVKEKALDYLRRANIAVTEREAESLEVAEYGLGEVYSTGLALIVYLNTDKCCAKELILFPRQTCPEHRHPSVNGEDGKEETFRCRWGKVYLYVEGEGTKNPKALPPKGNEAYYTVWKEIELNPGEQYTLLPNTMHWFQSGDEGAIVSEFSTKSRDEYDIYTDPRIDPAHERKA